MNYRVKNIYGKTKNSPYITGVPGSKSVTARALLLSALARGESTLYNVQFSDDCTTFLNCVKSLGIKCAVSGTAVTIQGCGGVLPVKEGEIYVGSAGTAARFLIALLAFSKGKFKADCSPQMKRRPVKPLIAALRAAGATVKGEAFPLEISGADEVADEIEVDVTESSQFLSALLISAVCAGKPVKIKPVGVHGGEYVKMTLDMMWSFGLEAEQKDGAYIVDGSYTGCKYDIEPDLSAAAYFYAANKILGTDIRVRGVMPHSMQGDGKFINLLKTFNGGKIDMSAFSDQALTLAAIAPYLEKPTEICNVAHIRGQECDRINAMVYNLAALGVPVEERADGVKIYPARPKGCKIKTFGDHRVAMSFALTGLRCDGVVIENAEVCAKTFPSYFDVLDEICLNLTKQL